MITQGFMAYIRPSLGYHVHQLLYIKYIDYINLIVIFATRMFDGGIYNIAYWYSEYLINYNTFRY